MHKNQMNITVAFGDCDPASMIYYPNYFEWFDRASWQLFETVGLPWEVLSGDYGIAGLPIVDAHAKFIAPVKWRDELVIESTVERWEHIRFLVSHLVYKGEALCARGSEMRVWAIRHPDDPERLKGSVVPQEVIARFAEAAGGGDGA